MMVRLFDVRSALLSFVLRSALVALLVAAVPGQSWAQFPNLLGGGNDLPLGEPSEAKVTISPTKVKAGDEVTIKVEVTIPPGSHTYSQSKEFSGRTNIAVQLPAGVTEVGSGFEPAFKPKAKFDTNLEQNVEVFEKDVSWTRRFRIGSSAGGKMKITGKIDYQVCDDNNCTPMTEKFTLELEVEKREAVFEARSRKRRNLPETSVWHVRLSPPDAQPGDTVQVSVEAKLKDGYHTFALDQDPKNDGGPPNFGVLAVTGLKPVDGKGFQTTAEVEDYTSSTGKAQRVHHEEVTWIQDFLVTEAGADGYGIAGKLRYQVCDESSCTIGGVTYELGTVNAEDRPVVDSPGPEAAPGESTANQEVFQDLKVRGAESGTLGTYLIYAFLGGLILNVMPCVLPVIAIKVLSFVQQAGEDRGRILTLNLVYSAGVVAVFLLLASLAVFAGLRWGNQFQNTGFNVAMTVFVFVMSLSLLDVFEIPIPGMVGSAAGGQQKEGLSGAFMTGIFATILATPCSGPFLGTALAWSVQQSPGIIYLTWLTMGVGMASPYVLFGLFPGAVKFLPKPGNWMVRFKQFAGFILLGTTIYLLSILSERMVIPTLVILLGVGVGLWMIGSFYNLTSPKAYRWKVRTWAVALSGLICYIGYSMTQPGPVLNWKSFSQQAVADSLKEGRPVMIDFTADWCATCKVMEKTTLNTSSTKQLVEEHDFVVLKADWTDRSEEIGNVLESVGQTSIPTLVIFSPTKPKEPFVINGGWTTSLLHSQLKTAIREAKGETSDDGSSSQQAALSVPVK